MTHDATVDRPAKPSASAAATEGLSPRSLRRRPVFAWPYILRDMLQARQRLLLVAYALVLGVEAAGNVWINFIGKGRTWDLYPLSQAFWVACSVAAVIVVARRPSAKRLAGVVIFLIFLDSFVDVCAMGGKCWWA